MAMLSFDAQLLPDVGEARRLSVAAAQLVIAGWTGRDRAAIEHHIEELVALGVQPPSRVPLYYRAAASLLTQDENVEVLGEDSSGEAEPVLFTAAGELWLTVGSDHTDRTVESYGVAVSKQMCAKPLARSAWRWQDVAAHQDELRLRSRIFEGGKWVTYQDGALTQMQPLAALLRACPLAEVAGEAAVTILPPATFMFCGTLPAIANAAGKAIRPAAVMEIELFDPRLDRRIVHRYAALCLPLVS